MLENERVYLAEFAYAWARARTSWNIETCDAFSEWYADQENGMYSLDAAALEYTNLLNEELDY